MTIYHGVTGMLCDEAAPDVLLALEDQAAFKKALTLDDGQPSLGMPPVSPAPSTTRKIMPCAGQ